MRGVKSLPTRDVDPSFANLAVGIVERNPLYGYEAVRHNVVREGGALGDGLESAPGEIRGFEDLAWLFASNQANFGMISMALDEAAYLYRLARSLRGATCLEIGRFKGGSSFLLAAAIDNESTLVSIDNHSKMQRTFSGADLDRELSEALARYGLNAKVKLLVGDSATFPVAGESYDLIFIDGDHTYEGVRQDWLNVRCGLKPEGHVLFHDAGSTRPSAIPHEGVARFVGELERAEAARLVRAGAVGTLVHLRRVGERLS